MPNRTPVEIGAHVRSSLYDKRITQQSVATTLQISRQSLIRRLNGEVEFSASEIALVAGLTDTTVDALVTAA